MTLTSARSPGQMIGALFLIQMIIGPIAQFGLLAPAIRTPPGFLASAATHACQVNTAVLLTLVASACLVGVAIAALPVLEKQGRAAGLWFLALAVISFMATLLEGAALRSMVALSQAFAQAGADSIPMFEAARELLRSLRNTVHFTGLLIAGSSLLLLYGVLFRHRMVPKLISGIGMLAAALLVAYATLALLGLRPMVLLLAPIGLIQLALIGRLLAKGFDSPPPVTESNS